MRRQLRAAGLAALIAAVALAAGCGGSDGSAGDAAASVDDRREGFRDAMLEYARCMRDEGIDMPDPSPGEGGGMAFRRGPGTDADTPAFEAADEKCRELLEDVDPPELSDEQREEFEQRALAFARCMREQGIDMPDPQLDGDGRVRMRVGPDAGVDPRDPAFQEASEACRDELPGGGPGGPPPAGP